MDRNFLGIDDFKTIIRNTPLISIDLIVENANQEILLGQRLNRPAKGTFFVPGGRIQKDEKIDEALKRISELELGAALSLSTAKFLGIYQHFYDNNFSNDDFSTHYVVLAYKFDLEDIEFELPYDQHSSYDWILKSEIINHPLVHTYTKDYFRITS